MRLILFGISLIALLLVAAVIGPSFVDWNKYKPQIVTQVKNATGLDVQIGGNLSMAVLPSPRVKIEDLTVVSPRKIQFENLLTMKSAEVSVELVPLFSKQIIVDSVKLIEPVIQIEMMADGTPSWETEKLAKAKEVSDVAPQEVKQSAGKSANKAMDSISLNELEIENGTLSYIDHKTKTSHMLKEVNVALEANSLKGPFKADGSVIYNDKKITLDAKTGKLPAPGEALNAEIKIGMPDANTEISFGGVAAIQEPYDVQGQTNIKIGSVQKLAEMFGTKLGDEYNQSLTTDGLLSADTDSVEYNNLKLSFGDFVANGKLAAENIKVRNPARISGNLTSASIFDLNPFLKASKNKTAGLDNGIIKKAHAQAGSKAKSLVPATLTLPMQMNVAFKLDVGGVKMNNQVIKGVFVDVLKSGSKADISFKALELPGQGKADGSLDISFLSASESSKTGQVTYADPSVTYKVNGQVGQLDSFLKAFAPDADTKAVTNLYKTAQFNLNGAVKGNTISLADSVLKLDQMVLGIGGRYEPAGSNGRAQAVVDVTAGDIDFDRIMSAQGKKSAPTVAEGTTSGGASGESAPKGSAKEALKPVQNLSLPMDIGFDLSVQKARINNSDLEGVRLTGDLTGNRLTLKNASVNSFAGATVILKGLVNDLSKLSGLDLQFYTKTTDVQKLATALKVDTSKFPADLRALDATVTGKGSIDDLVFNANLIAMGGQLDASGNASNVLETPAFSNLTVRLKHPNAVKAIQIASPSFKGATGLQQPVDFYTKAVSSGKTYTLSDMKLTLGKTSLGGNIKIDTSNKVAAIRGSIQAGDILLDELLGAKNAGGSASIQGSGGSSSASSGSGTSGKWSNAPINLDWMNSVDVDVDLAAASIKYGTWNFTKPSTDLKIANGVLNVDDLKAGIFGGSANLKTQVNAKPVSLTLATSMDNIDLESLAKAISGSGKLKSSGRVSFNTDVQATGNSSAALINALNGAAALNGTDVILKGFDLAKLARGLAVEEKLATSITSLIDGATSGGQTQFDTVKGDYKITNGTANVTSMVMDGPAAIITTTGYANFPKWYINLDNEIKLKEVVDLEPFNVKIKGPLNNPSDTFGKNILEDYLADKLKRKIGKELPGILGDDVTDKLQKFGILPPAQQQAPTQQQAPVDGQAPAEATPEPAPAQQEKDPLQKLLENPKDEDAIKGVIDGFLR